MYLLILESLGTWELLLVGMVALVIFGPRKIPELARKAGKMMAEFRKVSNEFRSTWEREAMLTDDEKKAFDFDDDTIARETSIPEEEHPSLKEAGVGIIHAEEEVQTVEGKEVEVNDIKDIVTLNLIDNMDDDELSTFIKENAPEVLQELEKMTLD